MPTLSSAQGIPPEPPKLLRPAPIPAQPVAHWSFDGLFSGAATGLSDGLQVRRVNVVPGASRDGRGAACFDGSGYFEVHGLGMHQAASIALWVKAESLGNRWSPLLFSNGGGRSAFHFSLRDDGAPERGDQHRRKELDPQVGQCVDRPWSMAPRGRCVRPAIGRLGSVLRRRQAGRHKGIDLGEPLDLTVVRVGAWSGWERQPQNNFHGLLADVRVYDGLLTDAAAAAMAAVERK